MSADNDQPAGDDDNDGFDYSGYLLFNKVCKTSLLGDFSLEGTSSDIERAVFDRLGEFEEGTAKNPGKGYEILDFRNFVYDEELDLPGELIDYAESLVTLRYKYEEYHEEIAEVNPGERKTVQIPAT